LSERDSIKEVLGKATKGDKAALGRLLTIIETSPKKASMVVSEILHEEGGAHVIGITGIPGSGKSTLISRLISHYKDKGLKIAVIAIDPTSPLSQGALLGDRIRMQEHATSPNVFIRSVPTRGVKGGLSFSGVTMIEVFDKLGYDKIIVESIGVGQTDIDIMNVAHTIVVVTTPGLGDDIQALKAGIMEIGDIYVLNKSDKPEANKTYAYLDFALDLGELGGVDKRGWQPRLLKTSAIMGEGIRELADTIEEHLDYIRSSNKYTEKIQTRRMLMVKLLAEKIFLEKLEETAENSGEVRLEKDNNLYQASINLIKKVSRELERE
jgi:LAO/AO transport system kinase